MRNIAILLALDAACDGTTDETQGEVTDADQDGYLAPAWGGDDCSDLDPSIHPDAPEHCDGVDEDCDTVVDDAPVDGASFFDDGDLDGFGAPGTSVTACEIAAGCPTTISTATTPTRP